jgi:hypothetical protein
MSSGTVGRALMTMVAVLVILALVWGAVRFQ